MSKFKCSCGFDEGSAKSTTDHMWDKYRELVNLKNSGQIELSEFKRRAANDHFASWLN